ncbi:hypothetical protein ETU08_00020 [Apibacter muscae]|uniref:hypothetical protein n=1 Tax=Apibacter muscae TaxID=2509004 RepID=UPI0011AD35EC|nr:hypothetical protein [Apibacter muscae]TWP31879.1 hypothetical protein ETU08_00020 [Apibacter muscae]
MASLASKKVQPQKKVVSNSVSLDVRNPIPFEPTGQSSAFLLTRTDRKYLPFLEPKDNFFQLLLEAKLLSPTNNACVNSKANFCIGKGIYFKDHEQKDKEFLQWVKRVNHKGQNLNKVFKSVFSNDLNVGNNFVEVIRGKIGTKRFIRVINRNFLDCRLSVPNDNDICETVFISKKFRQRNVWSLKEEEAVELPIYYGDPNMHWYVNEKQKTEHCIIHVKNEFSGYDYYGIPDNVSSLPWQILEYEGARYNIDIFENNLVSGGVVCLDGTVSQDEAKVIGQNIINAYTGKGKRGRIAVVAGAKGVTNSFFQPFNVQNDGSYLKLDESVESKIIDSNNWDSALYGQHKTSGIGNGGFAYLSSIFNTKLKTVIEPMQDRINQDLLYPLLEICDSWMGTSWSDFDLGFKTVSPVSFIGDINVNSVLTKNEGREFLGLPSLENTEVGEQLIEIKNNTIHV